MARVRPSPTSATLALAARLRAEGRDIISLGAGEPDFDTPQSIKDAAIAAIRAGDTKYTPIEGTLEVRQAVRRKFARENGLDYDVSQIVVSVGAKQAIFNLCMGLLDAGDEVIIPAPYWVSYPDIAAIADASPVVLATGIDQDFKVTPAQLRDALNERSRLLIFNSPSNPTGASYTRAEIEALGAVLEAYPRVVIAADDIYEHVQWADEPFVSFAAACPQLKDRVVTINGVSKAYAMTGWRIGYAAGPVEIIDAMKTIQSQCTSNPCSVSQAAAVAALNGDQAVVRDMTLAYRQRHDFLVPALNSIPGIECRAGEGSFYAFPRVTGAMQQLGLASDAEFSAKLLNEADVAVVPGSAFGAPGYVRLSFACSRGTLEEAVRRIERVVAA
jgi:aspartate aminotransferase